MTTPTFDFGYATLEQIAKSIKEAPVEGVEEHTPEYLAAAYVVQAQEETGYDLCEDSAVVHFEVLEEAGAQFDKVDALKLILH